MVHFWRAPKAPQAKQEQQEAVAQRMSEGSGPVLGVVVIGLWVLGLGIYFFPAFIAMVRHHPNALAIVILNLLLGWTLLGWVGAFVWSVTAIQPRT